MKKVSLVVHQRVVEDIIKKLYETGLMEIRDVTKEEPDILEDIERATTHPEAAICANYETRFSRLIDILKKIKPKKSGIKSFLKPELPKIKTVEKHSLEDIYSHAEGLLSEIENSIIKKQQKIQELKEKNEKIKFVLNQLNYLKDFDLDLSYIGESEFLIIKSGVTSDLEAIKNEIQNLKKSFLISKKFKSGKKLEWSVIIVSHISEKEKIEKIVREKVSEFEFNRYNGKPKDVIESLENEKKNIGKEKKQIISDLREYANKQLNDLLALREEIQLEKIRLEVSKKFAKTNSTYVIKGWVLEKDEDRLKTILKKEGKDYVISNFETPSSNPDNPPVYLKTPPWAQGFKDLLGMFATPKYNEINPTIIMGIFFIVFFGVMLGDAGYGLIILILSLFGYFKLKHSELIRSWSFMGIWMGITTTIVGFLTYSIFGNFFHMMFIGDGPGYLYSIPFLGKPLDSLRDPLIILTAALILGLIQLNVGIILGIIQAAKQKNYKKLVTEKFCWIPLQLGGGLLIAQSILGITLTDSIFYSAVIMVVVGLILLFIAAGPVGFFDITGYVGDWLSYARLLALGLATAGMALAFNEVATLLGEMIPFVGIVITIILLIILHLVNLALSALGAGVHSLRLQYVEFFNRFYEGGGKEFAPFKIKRNFTQKIDKNLEENI
jgi:V/A-type H+-transporting ATPase subunit I